VELNGTSMSKLTGTSMSKLTGTSTSKPSVGKEGATGSSMELTGTPMSKLTGTSMSKLTGTSTSKPSFGKEEATGSSKELTGTSMDKLTGTSIGTPNGIRESKDETEDIKLDDPTEIIPFSWTSSKRGRRNQHGDTRYTQGATSNEINYNSDIFLPKCIFPLESTHDYTLGCQACSFSNAVLEAEKWMINPPHPGCAKNFLFVRPKADSWANVWTLVRDRPFREFSGPHQMCWYSQSCPCRRIPFSCWFAHSKEENYIWNMEKYSPFDIETFKAESRRKMTGTISPAKKVPLKRQKFPIAKTHDFTLGCQSCATVSGYWWQLANHQTCCRLILFVRSKKATTGLWTKVRNRQSYVCGSTYKLCWNYPHSDCAGGDSETCQFAHNDQEIALWNAEKSGRFNIEEFKTQVRMDIEARHVIQPSPSNGEGAAVDLANDHNLNTRKEGKSMTSLEEKYELKKEISLDDAFGKLSQENYGAKMHDLLYKEEKFQQEIVAKITSIMKAKVSRCASVPDGPDVSAPSGVKFARIMLKQILSSEGNAGYLIQRNCNNVLLRPKMADGKYTKEAHEAVIVTKKMGYGINGLGNDHIFLFVSQAFLQAAKITASNDNVDIDVWVSFQMSRTSFCSMHLAIDNMLDLRILFPTTTQRTRPQKFDLKTDKLNAQQLKAMNQILHHQKGDPMLIIYGAFGTGKTMTLSTTALHLMRSEAINQRNKALIVTYSNSAANLFIHSLDKLNTQVRVNIQIMRVYSKNRHLSSIPMSIRRYTPMREDANGVSHPKIPSVYEIEHADIIITTVHTSMELVKLNVRGIFTHIFIDEACQTMEPELLIPLSLATIDTCVVLAGDVMQTSPQVYSTNAEELKVSLLERIFDRYEAENKAVDAEPTHTVTLTENYRNDQLILRFLSKEFYEDEEKLIWKSGIKCEEASLRFHVVKGEEKPGSGTSFYNDEEVTKIGQILSELSTNWPAEWGQKNLAGIVVTSMYKDQVERIKKHLRARQMGYIQVLQMENLQGWQYHVVLISTVHTANSTYPTSSSLGFLTDKKLVNTAISRAKYCVIVVGDAEALCTRGSNTSLWFTYLSVAHERNGLIVKDPDRFLDNRRALYDAEKISCNIERILKVFEEGKGEELLQPHLMNDPEAADPLKETFMPRNKLERITGIQVSKRVTEVDQVALPGKVGRAKREKRKWRPFNLADGSDLPQFEDESDGSEDDYEYEPTDEIEFDEKEKWESMLQTEPHFKRCQMNISSSRNIAALILDGYMKGKSVKIMSRRHCKRALDGDEVVVKLARDFTGAYLEPLQGEVMGVLSKKMKMKYRLIVCQGRKANAHMMYPLSSKLPLIYNNTKKEKSKAGIIEMFSLGKNGKTFFKKDVHMQDQSDLFIVLYLKWKSQKMFPLGIVVGHLPLGNNELSGQIILQYLHYVPKDISDTSHLAKEVKLHYPDDYLDHREFPDRRDVRDKKIFTVDDMSSKDLDDALHIENNADGTFTVGVHIADVTHFVEQDSDLDKEARKRGATFYGNKPTHMLPPHIATGQCSLLPEKDRLAVSMFYTVAQNGQILSTSQHLTEIRSKRKFSYEEVEAILNGESDDDWRQDISNLYEIAKVLAEKRKGPGGSLGIEDEKSPKAHMLIEEWMVLTNTHVAKHLLEKFPDRVPLRKQMAPTKEELDDWKLKYANQIAYSFCLQRIAKLLEEQGNDTANNGHVHIFRDTWSKLLVYHNEYQILEKIARSIDNFPEQACALKSWHAIQKKTVYHCSGSGEDYMYYNLGKQPYTHFTSPIRRYIDIIVHRLLKADIEQTPLRYSVEDISEICMHCSGAEKEARDYEGKMKLLISACDLKDWPNEVNVVVKLINEREIEVFFQALKHMPQVLKTIPFSWLDLKEDPAIEDGKAAMNFTQRIYDMSSNDVTYPDGDGACLDPKQFTVAIPGNRWKCLIEAIIDKDEISTLEIFSEIRDVVGDDPHTTYATDISSEHAVQNKKPQEIAFQRDIQHGDVLRVQLVAKLNKGVIMPCIQLIKLTPTFHICLEHARDPIDSFAAKEYCYLWKDDVNRYIKHWLALLTMESAYSVVRNHRDQSAHVYNVPAEWSKCSYGVVHGRLRIPTTFCRQRYLLFSIDVLYGSTAAKGDGGSRWMELGHDAQSLPTNCRDWRVTRFGLMCIKFDIKIKGKSSMTWVGHFLITDVIIVEEEVVVLLKLNQSTYDFPESVLNQSKYDAPLCAIHWMGKNIPDVRAETAVLGLLEISADSLPRKIAQRKIQPSREIGNGIDVTNDLPGLQQPNEEQRIALQTAFYKDNKFVLIWGPPGTGKSVTGVRLAYLFAKSNPSGKQVLYCGPSNKSVNVVTAKLKHLKDVKVVRIFSEQLVNKEYPVPHFPMKKDIQDQSLGEYADVALHRLVRLPGQPHAEEILEYDKIFRDRPQSVDMDDILKYKKLLAKAYHIELGKAQVVLCTCGSSGNGLYQKVFAKNVQQVIIDECGMCKEPETLIPLLACDPKKVVLIGDHKQLQPIINCKQARDGGLGSTLFEAYHGKAVMLQTQYRMHYEIQQFPSKQFYKGKLRIGLNHIQMEASKPSGDFWPAGPKKPIAFCHVEGAEKTQVVTTGIAGANSCFNMEEIDKVIKVVRALIKGKVTEEEIAILTPYRLQLSKIQEELNEKRLRAITVNSITNSQGSEWPYVILSTVRSLPGEAIVKEPWKGWCLENLGFLTDEHQVNVAITRAKKGLIIIGNENLLRCDVTWLALLEHYEELGAVTNGDFFPPGTTNRRRHGYRRT